jgi:hypothetical protein
MIDTLDVMMNALDRTEAALEADKPEGSEVCYQSAHYQIIDHGDDYQGRFVHRFALERKPEYAKSRVLPRHAASNVSAQLLVDAMMEAEKFHTENLPHCGGF